ncbi:MAG: magnesium/cobalt transporter CorA [Acidobacteriota bacterium]
MHRFNAKEHEEREVSLAELAGILEGSEGLTGWLRVQGLADVNVLQKVGELMKMHPLSLEDVMNQAHRSKVDLFDDHLFLILRLPPRVLESTDIESGHVAFVLRRGWVVSFEVRRSPLLEPVAERLRAGRPRIRSGGADYLLYALADCVVDRYFLELEQLDESLEILEEKTLSEPEADLVSELQAVKRELNLLRKTLWPMREAVGRLMRDEHPLVSSSTRLYLQDVYDHVIHLLESVESLRETASSLQEIYLSVLSQRMNEVMKVLTIIATIFIPLTFLVGVYGMNFEYMPELHYRWAYPIVWGVMVTVAALMVWYFRRKRWL